jgi:hypothetical protein
MWTTDRIDVDGDRIDAQLLTIDEDGDRINAQLLTIDAVAVRNA